MMSIPKLASLAVLFGQTFLMAHVVAGSFDSEFDEAPWKEIEVQLPAFPENENLIPFRVGAITDKKFFIDGNSLSVGSDEVIRYTLIAISSTGARNISYEGMRCTSAERRLYAFGRSDKTWSKARNNKWEMIKGDTNQYPVDLFSNYFCTIGDTAIRSAEDARRVLVSGRPDRYMGAGN